MDRAWEELQAHVIATVPAKKLLAGLSPEERLADLSPEERLEGLSPEDRLEGLSLDAIASALDREKLKKLLRAIEERLATEKDENRPQGESP
jgi:hypothetical protein